MPPMEIIALHSSDLKFRKSFKSDHRSRPILMLKDYLRDDLSSCSSNGFKSFPRKPHCCSSTIRFLVEIDVKGRDSSSLTTNSRRHRFGRSPSKAASATVSALQRASMRVLNAVKFLPLPAVKSPSPTGKNRARKGFLPRSLSRKLSKAGFWRKAAAVTEATGNEEPEIGRWKLFRDFLEQKDPPSLDKVTPLSATSATTSSSGSNSISWDSNDFGSSVTSVDLSSSFSVNSVNSGGKKDSILPPPLAVEEREKVGERVGVTVDGNESGAATTTESTSKEEWQNEDKEQFSPVSVLDCPFHDDEDITSPLHYSPMRIGGMKQKYMHKNHRFKSLSQLEPLNLDQRLTLSELGTLQTKPIDRPSSRNSSVEDEEAGHSNEAEGLLGAIKSKYPSMGFEVENLLSDFFIEKLEEVESQPNLSTRPKHEAVKLAEEWVTGSVEGVWLGWEVEKGREAYVREMEKGERWKNLEGENQEVGLELEFEVWSSLMEEILLDL